MDLRESIINEMKRNQIESKKKYGSSFSKDYNYPYCTWWFKFNIPFETAIIRKELEKMERDGIVSADRSQRNNTRWYIINQGNNT